MFVFILKSDKYEREKCMEFIKPTLKKKHVRKILSGIRKGRFNGP